MLVFDGDSVSRGAGVDDAQAPASQIARLLKDPVRIVTVAVSGKPVSASLADFQRNVAPHYDPKARSNIIAFHGGDNDIAGGRTANQAYASLSRYIETAHAQGWKVIVSTELERPDWDAAAQAALREYNRLELRNAAGADAVIDYASAPGMSGLAGRESSGFYSADRIHPSARGYALLADMLHGAILAITSRN